MSARTVRVGSVILDMCAGSGAWSAPYEEAGYTVHRIDTNSGQDVRLLPYKARSVLGILAAPPCTDLASSGARWWKQKGEEALLAALGVADACLRAVALYRPGFWALEQPVGRLRTYYGPPTLTFDPCDYGDPYTKKTCLWGQFVVPPTCPVPPIEGSKMHLLPPTKDRPRLRSVTPPGFARAFFEANP